MMEWLAFAVVFAVGGLALAGGLVRRRVRREYTALVAWAEGRAETPPPVDSIPGGERLVGALRALERASAAHEAGALEAEREVDEASALRSRLVAHVTHDLRSPLNAILGFADALANDPFSSFTPEQRQSLHEIRCAASELERLVSLILDSARIDADRLPLVGENVAVVELVTHAVENLRDPRAAARVDVALVPGLPTVWVDRARFVRALSAIVAHALEAGTGARFSARLEFDERRDPFVVLSLEASTGIEPARYAQLVDGKASLGAATRPRLASAALALSLARGLLAMSGGRLEFGAGEGGAPRFRFRLPVKGPAR
ncbi:MAG: HAMP domain-containing histidine kinase [Myxococcales bacterium]|nr:HAMP domain-containing histidine kinase [Myxococcales bacterium]